MDIVTQSSNLKSDAPDELVCYYPFIETEGRNFRDVIQGDVLNLPDGDAPTFLVPNSISFFNGNWARISSENRKRYLTGAILFFHVCDTHDMTGVLGNAKIGWGHVNPLIRYFMDIQHSDGNLGSASCKNDNVTSGGTTNESVAVNTDANIPSRVTIVGTGKIGDMHYDIHQHGFSKIRHDFTRGLPFDEFNFNMRIHPDDVANPSINYDMGPKFVDSYGHGLYYFPDGNLPSDSEIDSMLADIQARFRAGDKTPYIF